MYMFLMEERSKQGQTNKQGKATQHTQGSHFSYMYVHVNVQIYMYIHIHIVRSYMYVV